MCIKSGQDFLWVGELQNFSKKKFLTVAGSVAFFKFLIGKLKFALETFYPTFIIMQEKENEQ